jgi:hypothetical protein
VSEASKGIYLPLKNPNKKNQFRKTWNNINPGLATVQMPSVFPFSKYSSEHFEMKNNICTDLKFSPKAFK